MILSLRFQLFDFISNLDLTFHPVALTMMHCHHGIRYRQSIYFINWNHQRVPDDGCQS